MDHTWFKNINMGYNIGHMKVIKLNVYYTNNQQKYL